MSNFLVEPKVERKVFKSHNRRTTIKRYLEVNGSLSLEELKEGFRNENKILESEDSDISEWLDTIDGVSRTRVDGVVKYSVPDLNPGKRKCASPLSNNGGNQTPKRQMTDHHHENRKATATTARFNNAQKRQSRPSQPVWRQNLEHPARDIRPPHLFNMPLFGDDQLLNIALFDLNFVQKPNKRPRQSGHCVSGLRIREATQRLHDLDAANVERIIVNVGSVDVAEGRQLIELIHDISRFVKKCDDLSIKPILTTLAPLPNYSLANKKDVLLGFNFYMLNHLGKNYPVIDLHPCMLTEEGKTNLSLYQYDSRFISGSKRAFVMWNKIGRQRILQTLYKELGQAIVYDKPVATNEQTHRHL